MRRATLSLHVILLLAALVLAGGRTAAGQDFTLQVGPPTAASPRPGSGEVKVSKGMFAVRALGCTDAASATISATAEGFDGGVRRSVPLRSTMPMPDVHLVLAETDGIWVVRLVGQCGDKTAGAIVTLAPSGAYRRDGVEYVAGAPTPAQIDRALQALMSGPSAVAAAR